MMKPSPSIEYIQLPHLFVERTIPIGKRIVIVAESEKGILPGQEGEDHFYHPIPVHNLSMAQYFFRAGDLIECYQDATLYNKDLDVYLMRIEPYRFDKAFEVLMLFPFDLVYIDGLTYDNGIESFIELAQEKEYQGQLIHGIFDLPQEMIYEDLLPVYSFIGELTGITEDQIVESGKYLSFVLGQVKEHRSGAVYAGLLAALNPEESPINRTLSLELKYELEKDQILELREAGIVCFKDTFKKGVVCTSSSCAVATKDSVHKHISNFRIAQYVIQEVAEMQQTFIGRTNPKKISEQLFELTQSILDRHIQKNRIRDYVIDMAFQEGALCTRIDLVPIFSVYKISANAQIRIYK